MLVYISLALIMLVLDTVYLRVADRFRNRIWVVACFAMWFVLAFRGERIGNDTIIYLDHFDNLIDLPWNDIVREFDRDQGFYYFVKLTTLISHNHVWFVALTSFLSCIGVWVYIKQNAERPVLALFFYITLANFAFIITGIRQGMAMSFCLLALSFVKDKKLIKFAVLIFLAYLCHKSAILFAIMYFIGRRKVNIINMIINVIAIAVMYFGYERWLALANDLLGYDYEVEELSNGGMFFVVLLAVMVLAFISHKVWLKGDKNTISMNMGVITTGMWTIRLFSRTIERPAMYWLNSIPVILTNSIEAFKGTDYYFVVQVAPIGMAFLLFLYRSLGVNYAFFWQ